MVEETAKVLKVEGDIVWVQAIQQSACGSCQAQKGCGHSLLAKVGQKQIDLPVARNSLDVQVNDQVIIGVPEQAIFKVIFDYVWHPIIFYDGSGFTKYRI